MISLDIYSIFIQRKIQKKFFFSKIENLEKLILYTSVGVLLTLVALLFIALLKLNVNNRRYRKLASKSPLKANNLNVNNFVEFETPLVGSKENNSTNYIIENELVSSSSSQLHLTNSSPSSGKMTSSATPSSTKSKRKSSKSSSNSSNKPSNSNNNKNIDKVRLVQINMNPNIKKNHQSNRDCDLAIHDEIIDNDFEYSKNNQKSDNHFEGYKLITQKIMNNNYNDNISEYEIPIIRYNENSLLQQYATNNNNYHHHSNSRNN
jgi:hypothetical protein